MGKGFTSTVREPIARRPCWAAGLFCPHKKQGRAANDAASTLAAVDTARAGLYCNERPLPSERTLTACNAS